MSNIKFLTFSNSTTHDMGCSKRPSILSDDSVESPFFLVVSLKFLLVLKSFNGVSRQFKVCLKFNGSFKAVPRKF